MSALVDVEAAIVSALTSPTPVAPQIQRGRSNPLAQENATGVFVALVSAEIERAVILSGPVDITSRVVVECQARPDASQAPSTAVDALLTAVNSRIVADPTLGGKVMDCMLTGLDYQVDDVEQSVVACITTWEVLHRASRSTLATV